MKKILTVLLVITIVFAITGCNGKKTDIVPVTKGISFTAQIDYYNECYECLVTVNDKNDMIIELTSPDTVKGMTFNFKDNDVTVKYNDLQYKYSLDSMPEGVVCSYIYQIFNNTMEDNVDVMSDKDCYYIQGETKNCKYKMILGETGLPIEIKENESGMNVTLKNVSVKK